MNQRPSSNPCTEISQEYKFFSYYSSIAYNENYFLGFLMSVILWFAVGFFYPQHAHFSVMSILSLIISHKSFSEKLLPKYLFSHNMKFILTALCNLYFPLLNFFPFFNSLMDFHGCLVFKPFLSNIVVISPFVHVSPLCEDPRRTQYRMKYILEKKKNLFSTFLS